MRTSLHPATIKAIQKAVEDEAEALQLSLNHPHIVQVKSGLLSLAERAKEYEATLAEEYEATRDDD